MKKLLLSGAACIGLSTPIHAQTQEHHNHHHDHNLYLGSTPASIMADHAHSKGDWMISYRFMHMNMEGNRDGTNKLSPLDISGDFDNITGTGPTTLRIVPTEMTMNMHMLGAMYGITENVTMMVMANYLDKEMEHITFAGANADLELGRFTTNSQGWADTKISGVFNAYQNGAHIVVAKAGLSLPTGSIKERGDILNPMNATQNIRLPYAMQLGSGTYDLEPALTYTAHNGKLNWGAQYMGQIRLGENSQDYSLGDKHRLTSWGGYTWNDNIQTLVSLAAEHEGKINGRDTNIAGPVQTADPDNYGGKRLELGLGLNLTGTEGLIKGHSIGIEATTPLHQDLNGPQMERNYSITAAYKVTF